MRQRPSILFRCDGFPGIGLGHVSRCLALGKVFSLHHECQVAFAMSRDPVGFSLVEREGYPVWRPSPQDDLSPPEEWLLEVIHGVQANVLVLDVREGASRVTLQGMRRRGPLIVTIDDPSERRLEADFAIYPPVPQVPKLNWSGFSGQVHAGWEWVILRDEFRNSAPGLPHDPPIILVSMGGSDPAGMTLKALKALEDLECYVQVIVVLGKGFQDISAVTKWVEASRLEIEVKIDVEQMGELMRHADLAVSSYGGTSYELAAMGVPAVMLCLSADHMESARALQDEGVGVCLGVHSDVGVSTVSRAVKELLEDAATRSIMSSRGRELVDGMGAYRIASLVMSQLEPSGEQKSASREFQSLSS